MGDSPDNPAFHVADGPHAVHVEAFSIAPHEVTQAQWASVDGTNPSTHAACGETCPITNVDWYSALAFTNWLSTEAGLAPCYAFVPTDCADEIGDWTDGATVCTDATFAGLSCTGYRLPTSAEWELAARAGEVGILPADLDATAWYIENSGVALHAVGEKAPNAFGLFDAIGNAAEWVWDRWDSTPWTSRSPTPIRSAPRPAYTDCIGVESTATAQNNSASAAVCPRCRRSPTRAWGFESHEARLHDGAHGTLVVASRGTAVVGGCAGD